jgi:hypothetical protein
VVFVCSEDGVWADTHAQASTTATVKMRRTTAPDFRAG